VERGTEPKSQLSFLGNNPTARGGQQDRRARRLVGSESEPRLRAPRNAWRRDTGAQFFWLLRLDPQRNRHIVLPFRGFLGVFPLADSMRPDPRSRQLLHRMNLPFRPDEERCSLAPCTPQHRYRCARTNESDNRTAPVRIPGSYWPPTLVGSRAIWSIPNVRFAATHPKALNLHSRKVSGRVTPRDSCAPEKFEFRGCGRRI
jgi:hypothetical protein